MTIARYLLTAFLLLSSSLPAVAAVNPERMAEWQARNRALFEHMTARNNEMKPAIAVSRETGDFTPVCPYMYELIADLEKLNAYADELRTIDPDFLTPDKETGLQKMKDQAADLKTQTREKCPQPTE